MSGVLIGFVTSLSLIVAIGAQNAFVLRQGLRRQHVVPIVLLCSACDAALITAGIAGLGTLITSSNWALDVTRYGGAAFVTGYGLLAARRAARPRGLAVGDGGPATLSGALLACLAFTFLNPHVYLDTVVLLGSLANQHGADGRWAFGGGAALGSLVWFCALGFGARIMSPFFEKPRSWQLVDAVIAVVMIGLGVMLLVG